MKKWGPPQSSLFMPDFDSILPKLKRVEGTPLDDSDKAKLREFFARFDSDSDAELERKRGVMRERLRKAPPFTYRGPEGEQVRRSSSWKDPHLDQAKHDILTAIIQGRQSTGIPPISPAPKPSPAALWQRFVAFTGGTGRAIAWLIGVPAGIAGLARLLGLF